MINRKFLLICLNNILTTVTVLSNFLLIRHHDQIPRAGLPMLLIVSTGSTSFLLITYKKFGEINERSKSCTSSWKRNTKYLNLDEKILVSTYVRSFRPFRMELGSFGFYQKPNTIRIVGKLFFYTSKFLLMTIDLF